MHWKKNRSLEILLIFVAIHRLAFCKDMEHNLCNPGNQKFMLNLKSFGLSLNFIQEIRLNEKLHSIIYSTLITSAAISTWFLTSTNPPSMLSISLKSSLSFKFSSFASDCALSNFSCNSEIRESFPSIALLCLIRFCSTWNFKHSISLSERSKLAYNFDIKLSII